MEHNLIRGVCFDLDGTLANSLHVMQQCYFDFLNQFGIKGSIQEFHKLNGPPISKVIQYLVTQYNVNISLDVALTIYLTQVSEAYQKVLPMSGCFELLDFFVSNQIKCVVVTSNMKTITLKWLEMNQLDKFFSGLICQEDIQQGKPHPEPYLKAVELLKLRPESVCALEDSMIGIQSAQAACLKAILISNTEQYKPCATDFHQLLEQWKSYVTSFE